MSDIFISYSKHDRLVAISLVEQLRTAGYSVWIDRGGIEAATTWSEEIAKALEASRVLILLMSQTSFASKNVAKELSLAAEADKHIIPIRLERIPIPSNFKYHLAGLQHTSIEDFDAIIRALEKLGVSTRSEGIGEITPIKFTNTDPRKTLMILPFEDLSPTHDNEWFADGIVSEMISALTNVKSLRIADAQTTKEFKTYRGQLSVYAREMRVRYFVQGDVRKFGDNIKISARLLDIETGDHLWQDSLKGTMEDIFDIQEQVAGKVVEGLKLHLTVEEKDRLAERETENPEAFELYLKAREYNDRQTKENSEYALTLTREALRLDPNFAEAAQLSADILFNLYRTYYRRISYLEEAEIFAKRAIDLKPNLRSAYSSLSLIYVFLKRLSEAEEMALENVKLEPKNAHSHFALGTFYTMTDQPIKAIPAYEASVNLENDRPQLYWNLVLACRTANELEKAAYWAKQALPSYEKKTRLSSDKKTGKILYSAMLYFAGRTDDALNSLRILLEEKDLDSASIYNCACLYADLLDYPKALTIFRRAVEEGFTNIKIIQTWNNHDWVIASPDYQKEVNEIIALAKARADH